MKSQARVANSHGLILTSSPGQNFFLPGVWKLFCDGQKPGLSMVNAEKQKYYKTHCDTQTGQIYGKMQSKCSYLKRSVKGCVYTFYI